MRYSLLTQKGDKLAQSAIIAEGYFQRMKGLMFQREFNGLDAMIFKSCNGIHTCFMLMSIDVLFLNKKNEVVKIYKSLRPWRFTRFVWGANKVIELPSSTLDEKVQIGDKLEIKCISS